MTGPAEALDRADVAPHIEGMIAIFMQAMPDQGPLLGTCESVRQVPEILGALVERDAGPLRPWDDVEFVKELAQSMSLDLTRRVDRAVWWVGGDANAVRTISDWDGTGSLVIDMLNEASLTIVNIRPGTDTVDLWSGQVEEVPLAPRSGCSFAPPHYAIGETEWTCRIHAVELLRVAGQAGTPAAPNELMCPAVGEPGAAERLHESWKSIQRFAASPKDNRDD